MVWNSVFHVRGKSMFFRPLQRGEATSGVGVSFGKGVVSGVPTKLVHDVTCLPSTATSHRPPPSLPRTAHTARTPRGRTARASRSRFRRVARRMWNFVCTLSGCLTNRRRTGCEPWRHAPSPEGRLAPQTPARRRPWVGIGTRTWVQPQRHALVMLVTVPDSAAAVIWAGEKALWASGI